MMRAALLGCLAAAGFAFSAVAYTDGPPPGYDGAGDNPTCAACHTGGEIDPAQAQLAVEGLPERYRSGQRYRLTVILSAPGMERAGFQASIRYAAGPRPGARAGRLEPCDERTAVVPGATADIAYAQHSLAGAALIGPGEAKWCLHWTAPADPAPVIVHAVGNAANYDDSEFGDTVISRTIPVSVAPRPDP